MILEYGILTDTENWILDGREVLDLCRCEMAFGRQLGELFGAI